MKILLVHSSIEQAKDEYSKLCLSEADKACKEAKFQLNLANTLIEESHRFDNR